LDLKIIYFLTQLKAIAIKGIRFEKVIVGFPSPPSYSVFNLDEKENSGSPRARVITTRLVSIKGTVSSWVVLIEYYKRDVH